MPGSELQAADAVLVMTWPGVTAGLTVTWYWRVVVPPDGKVVQVAEITLPASASVVGAVPAVVCSEPGT